MVRFFREGSLSKNSFVPDPPDVRSYQPDPPDICL